MSALQAIVPRLSAGRPLLLSPDPIASLREMGFDPADPTAVGRLLRESASVVTDLYACEVEAGVDVIAALTTHTMPRSLAAIGMAFRAAALTSLAVDLALEVAERATRPVAVAGALGGDGVRAGRATGTLAEELATHAARLAAAGCGLLLARGEAARHERAGLAITSAGATGLPTWAVLQLDADGRTLDGESLENSAKSAIHAGAHLLLCEVDSAERGALALARLSHVNVCEGVPTGVLLTTPARVSGARAPGDAEIEAWAEGVPRLVDAGARVLGGGFGTTPRHIAALARGLDRLSAAGS